MFPISLNQPQVEMSLNQAQAGLQTTHPDPEELIFTTSQWEQSCSLCKERLVLNRPTYNMIEHVHPKKNQKQSDCFHVHCFIKVFAYAATCPFCLTHCRNWLEMVEEEGGLRGRSSVVKKLWQIGCKLQIYSQVAMKYLLAGPLISSQICGIIGICLPRRMRIWILPLVLFLGIVEFTVRLMITGALTWLLVGGLAGPQISLLIVILYSILPGLITKALTALINRVSSAIGLSGIDLLRNGTRYA
jgi:hypothetical protein